MSRCLGQHTWSGPLLAAISALFARGYCITVQAVQKAWIETIVTPTTPYVQQHVLYTVRAFWHKTLRDGELKVALPHGAVAERFGDAARFERLLGTEVFNVIERRWVLAAAASGTLAIAPAQLRAQAPVKKAAGGLDLYGRDYRQADWSYLTATGDAYVLTVRPRPASDPYGASGSAWLPAVSLNVRTYWQEHDGTRAAVGEPTTWVVAVAARGLAAAQLPVVVPPQRAGLQVYEVGNTVAARAAQSGLLTTRVQRFAMVSRRGGEFALPPVQIPWWDVNADVPRVARAPGRTLTTLSAAPAKSDEQSMRFITGGVLFAAVAGIMTAGIMVAGIGAAGIGAAGIRHGRVALLRWMLWIRLRIAFGRGREASVRRLILAVGVNVRPAPAGVAAGNTPCGYPDSCRPLAGTVGPSGFR